MRVLVACEMSGRVTNEFRKLGHEAYSCDILPTEGNPDWHIQDDVLKHLDDGWDLMIGHPPCTFISYAGTRARNDKGRVFKRLEALDFFAKLWEANIPKICLENPKSVASPVIAKYSQEIQPYYFGDAAMKTTWLWLKGLPKLVPTNNVGKPSPTYIEKSGKRRYFADAQSGFSKNSRIERSRTFVGIAKAMAEQWGGDIRKEKENVPS